MVSSHTQQKYIESKYDRLDIRASVSMKTAAPNPQRMEKAKNAMARAQYLSACQPLIQGGREMGAGELTASTVLSLLGSAS